MDIDFIFLTAEYCDRERFGECIKKCCDRSINYSELYKIEVNQRYKWLKVAVYLEQGNIQYCH